MNRSQWYVLSAGMVVIGFLLAYISTQWKNLCFSGGLSNSIECIRSNIFAPYPYIFFTLFIIFIILGSMEREK